MGRRAITGLALLAMLSGVGCAKPRDLHDPLDRPTHHTAWSEARGKVRLDTSVGGIGAGDLGVRLGATVGVGAGVELSANFAHYAAALFNVGGGWTLLDTKVAALKLDVTVLYMRPQWMWYLDSIDPELQDDLGRMNALSIPFGLTASFLVTDWLVLDVGLGYDHTSVFGTIDTEMLLFQGAVGSRRLWASPGLQILVGRYVLIGAGATLPFHQVALAEAVVAVQVEPGVVAGARAKDWVTIDPLRSYAWHADLELLLGRTYVHAGVSSTGFTRWLGAPVFPYLGASWRL